jgi:hypothetical protein
MKKYTLYAIGEIALVVIGILIALQINNLNENRKDRLKEKFVLQQLREDYQANLIQLEQKMAMRNVIVQSAYKFLEIQDRRKEINRDSLITYVAQICDNPTFDPIQSDLVSSGNLRLITNEKLKKLLSNWSSDIVTLQELEVMWTNKINLQLDPVIAKLGISREVANSWMISSNFNWLLDSNSDSIKTINISSNHSTPINEIVSNRELEGLITMAITYNQPANMQSKALVNRINEILTLINNEIQ